jgi:6-pyruvoyltetrahydropterin/6-carboxytetrahydropterin synthase
MKTDKYEQTFKLWKDFTFEAAHQLTKVPPGHQCGQLHGHSYKVRIHCKGKLNPDKDWVIDYAEIASAVKPIISELDHSFLNHILDIETTAENLAWWIGQKITKKLGNYLYAVEVFETPTTSVICEL